MNTVDAPLRENPVDYLQSYEDVVRWCGHGGVFEAAEVQRLAVMASSRSREADGLFARALALRAALDNVGSAIALGRIPADADLKLLRAEYVEAIQNARLVPIEEGFEWSWDSESKDLRKPLWLIAHSAVRLLQDGDLRRIKQCPGADDCGWLFYDTSKPGRRRWCSMEGCGSRVKMRRHYARQKQRVAGA